MAEVRFNSTKWANRASGASGDYAQGATRPRRSQSAAAIAAKGNYAAGIQEAISQDRYAKGLQKAGDAKWQQGIASKGQRRYSEGVLGAESRYQAGFAPYAQALGAITLPPRGPKGQNYGRVQLVGDTLRKTKLAK